MRAIEALPTPIERNVLPFGFLTLPEIHKYSPKLRRKQKGGLVGRLFHPIILDFLRLFAAEFLKCHLEMLRDHLRRTTFNVVTLDKMN
jgi:hypothetical protein